MCHVQANSSYPIINRHVETDTSRGTLATSRLSQRYLAPHGSHCSVRLESTTALGGTDCRQGPDARTVGVMVISDPLPGSCGRFTDDRSNHNAAGCLRSREFAQHGILAARSPSVPIPSRAGGPGVGGRHLEHDPGDGRGSSHDHRTVTKVCGFARQRNDHRNRRWISHLLRGC